VPLAHLGVASVTVSPIDTVDWRATGAPTTWKA
jgi:hypothetical protein